MATVQEALEGLADPEVLHIINISGGKDSAALAVHVKERYPRIHEAALYLFCDTGTELPETYEYLRRLEAFLGKPVQRLTALATHGIREKPGRTAFEPISRRPVSGQLYSRCDSGGRRRRDPAQILSIEEANKDHAGARALYPDAVSDSQFAK